MTQRVLKSHRSKMRIIYICSQKDRQCALPVYIMLILLLWDLSAVCSKSLLTSFIMLLAWNVEYSLVSWYQQCVTVRHVPKCMSYHEAIGGFVITGRAYCRSFSLEIYIYIYIYHYILYIYILLHIYIYIYYILLLWDLSTLCVMSHV